MVAIERNINLEKLKIGNFVESGILVETPDGNDIEMPTTLEIIGDNRLTDLNKRQFTLCLKDNPFVVSLFDLLDGKHQAWRFHGVFSMEDLGVING